MKPLGTGLMMKNLDSVLKILYSSLLVVNVKEKKGHVVLRLLWASYEPRLLCCGSGRRKTGNLREKMLSQKPAG